MNKPILSVKNVSYQYPTFSPILDDVSFTVSSGEYLGIVGPNGSGKTTLLKLILGILPTEEGIIELFGEPIKHFTQWNKVGYIPQDVFVGDKNFPATVREVIESGLHNRQHHFAHIRHKHCPPLEQAAKLGGVEDLLDRLVGELSGGERQRVFIARALISEPTLLILDEPTSGIDIAAEEAFFALLKKLNADHGLTIILVSHDLEALAHNAKTALCLNRRVIYYGDATGLHSERVIESVFGARTWHSLETHHYGS